MNKHIGHELQLYGAYEYRLTGGKADGMRMLRVKNGCGLDFEISLDRCADIVTMAFKGENMGYFSPCGYVSPKFYDNKGFGFLKSFTAGFFTTCGLTAVGSPCIDNGEELPLHGTISNTPCESYCWYIENDEIHIKAKVRDASIFAHKLILEREYICPLSENTVYLKDKITNIGAADAPLEVLYHCNMGYPLLSENAVVDIPSFEVEARNEHSGNGIENCRVMEKPQAGYEEKCYYHSFADKHEASVFNPDINRGVKIEFCGDELKYFTQWKMMGEYDYVLGLEPGNCLPDGRDVMREKGILEILKPGEIKTHHIKFEFTEEK